MPHQEKHPKVNAAGEITHVFGHRFVLKTASKPVLADLTPRGLEVVVSSSAIASPWKASRSRRKSKCPSLNATEKHLQSVMVRMTPANQADPAIATKTAENAGYQVIGEPRRKPKHFEVLGKGRGI